MDGGRSWARADELLSEIVEAEAYRVRLASAYGRPALRWLDTLPDRVEALAHRWQLALLRPYLPVSFNVVMAVDAGQRGPAVLKLVPPGAAELRTELRVLSGRPPRMARLLASDADDGAMLLERAVPGTRLSELAREDDVAATEAIAELLREVPVPAPSGTGLPTVREWGAGLARMARAPGRSTAGWIDAGVLDLASGVYRELAETAGSDWLLHGDLHHFNVLAASDPPWLAIDPKGVIGPRGYEVGAMLRNPGPDLANWPDPVALTRRRIAILVERLALTREEVWGWGFSQAVMSAVWADEDDETVWRSYALWCAETLLRARSGGGR